jgi:hypothetical protein
MEDCTVPLISTNRRIRIRIQNGFCYEPGNLIKKRIRKTRETDTVKLKYLIIITLWIIAEKRKHVATINALYTYIKSS